MCVQPFIGISDRLITDIGIHYLIKIWEPTYSKSRKNSPITVNIAWIGNEMWKLLYYIAWTGYELTLIQRMVTDSSQTDHIAVITINKGSLSSLMTCSIVIIAWIGYELSDIKLCTCLVNDLLICKFTELVTSRSCYTFYENERTEE